MGLPEIPSPPGTHPPHLLLFEFSQPGQPVEERLVLGPDGHVTRTVRAAAGDRPALGWWAGNIDEAVLGVATELAARSWAGSGPAGSQPAAGAWTAAAGGQSIGLWADDDIRGPLQSVLGACSAAAVVPRAAVELHAAPPEVPDGDAVMVHLEPAGDDPVVLVIDIEGADPGAAFLTADASTVGFLGGEMRLEPGTAAFGAVYGMDGAGPVVINGSLRVEGRDDLSVRASLNLER